MNISSKNMRFLGVATFFALGLSLFILSDRLSFDLKIWQDLSKPLSENFSFLNTSLQKPELKNPLAEISALGIGMLVLAFAGINAGYTQPLAGRVVNTFQLLLLGFLYQALLFNFFSIQPRFLTFSLILLASIFTGSFLKKREREIKEIEQVTTKADLLTRDLQESRLVMVKQDEEDRRLLAADLHDQVLNDMRVTLARFEEYADSQGTAGEEAKNLIIAQMKTSMTDIREIMDDLCPVILSEFGLCAAIEERLDKAAKQFKLKVRFRSDVQESDLAKFSIVEQQLIYRLVQESITNVCKHAKASTVKINVSKQQSTYIFRTTDDGIGVDLSKMSDSSRGTMYMRLRASLIGATISFEKPDQASGFASGTSFVLSVPEPV
ncbi:MAG: hypothetical protein KIT34_06775 [Cyanobacteria bacterium TGS_CYA1]|nr:hypothetical protein [Cyanobacteria bacterium TGS_CYA1]